MLLLASSGVVTCVPLLAFAAAAQALPLSVLGLMQYLTPVAQFLLGVLLVPRGDAGLPVVRLRAGLGRAGVFTFDALRQAKNAHDRARDGAAGH